MSIVIAAVPYIETDRPIMAPALLKSIIKEHGFDSVAMDLNVLVVDMLKDHPNKEKIVDFFYTENITPELIDDVNFIITQCANKIAEHNPQIIGLSLLIYGCQIFTKWLCALLRQLCPEAKIVIGGSGIKSFVARYDDEFFLNVKSLGLIDDYIHGDGDLSFPEYIKGNLSFPGINSTENVMVDHLDQLPFPDYSDYVFSMYPAPVIPIIDSRGCVKNCEFCDVIEFWQKFQWRTAESIFSEMLHQIQQYNNSDFEFRSSLVNGNMKEFKKLLDLICEYNEKTPDKQIKWAGYFIIRSKAYHTPELWEKIGRSNGTLWLGVESLIPRVRINMGKPYTNEDLDWHLEASKIYSVPLILLMMVAYPIETLEDYEFTKDWFRNRKQYANSVLALMFSYASILPGTQLARKSSEYGIKTHPILPSVWINQNLNISSSTRLKYYNKLVNICKDECGFTVFSNQEQTLIHTNKNGSFY